MIKRILKALAKIFSPLPLSAVFCLILAVIVAFYGARVGYRGYYPLANDSVRGFFVISLLVLSALLFTFLIVRGIYRWVKAKRAAQERPARERTEAEIECGHLDRIFVKVSQVIKSRWTGSGRGIYGLPWYIMLGDTDAGKSSIIDVSGLRFPIDNEIKGELAEFGNGQAASVAHWRVAGKEAVLIDLNGAFFTDARKGNEVREALWNRFVFNLNKIRPRRPLNGAILCIDFLKFASLSHEGRAQYAASVRADVNDLIERLGTRMTIHIVFTKIDLVGGFPDYFEALSSAEREQPFGFHFTYAGKHSESWVNQFDSQYDVFVEAIGLQLKKRILAIKGTRSRSEAFSFYRTMLGLEQPMKVFLADMLGPDRFTTPPLVRAVYFGSSRQESVPQNVFLEAIGSRYGLSAPLYSTSQAVSLPFFSNKLLTSAIFPEAGLAGNNLNAEARYRKQAILAACISAVALGGASVFWAGRYQTNLAQAELVANKAQEFVRLNASGQYDPTGVTVLEPLNTARDATFAFGDYRTQNAVLATLSLDQGKRIGPIADAAYRAVLNGEFAPELVRGVEDNLRDVCPKGGDEELQLLRVYRMMGELDGRDNGVVAGYFRDLWQTSYTADAALQRSLNNHLSYMLNQVPDGYDIDADLVQSAQLNLGSFAPYERVYSTLRANALSQLPDPIEFRSSVGATFDIVYEANPIVAAQQQTNNTTQTNDADDCGLVREVVIEREPFQIPRFFTKPEFFDFFIPQNEQVSRVAADDLWVLGQLQSTEYSEADYQAIQNALRESYVDDYIRTWRSALNAMSVREFTDIRDAVQVLRGLSGPSNPIRRVARLVQENTIIYDPEQVPIDEENSTTSNYAFDLNRAVGLRINAEFNEINRMLQDAPDGGKTNMEEIQDALTAVYDYVKTVQDAPDPNARALELAVERARLTGEDPIFVLQRIADRAPAPFNQHLTRIADESWRVIVVAATNELNRRWHEDIYGDYERLIAGKYPFDRESTEDLPLDDFKSFFGPGGSLDTFYNERLLTFIDEGTGEPRMIDGQSLAVDRDFAARLRAAIDITRHFFDEDGDFVVEFTVAPERLNANLARAVFNVEGQVVVSSHSPSRPVSIIVPNIIDGSPSSRIEVSSLSGAGAGYSQSWDGPWSWLRLYDAAGKSNLANNSVDLSFANRNGQSSSFRVRTESETNLFFNSPLSGFSLPAHLRSLTQ